MPRLFFQILSFVYISAIFILGRSSAIQDLSPFNPYSLLHVPLYGILTVLLVFAFVLKNQGSRHPAIRFLIVGSVGLGVAAADEIHQVSLPGRTGSMADVFLDMAGIALALFLMFRFLKTNPSNPTNSINPNDPNG